MRAVLTAARARPLAASMRRSTPSKSACGEDTALCLAGTFGSVFLGFLLIRTSMAREAAPGKAFSHVPYRGSDHDLLNLAEVDRIAGAVVELGGLGRLVGRDVLGFLENALV